MRKLLSFTALGLGLCLWAGEAQAATTVVGHFDGNDCGGPNSTVNGFADCYASLLGTSGSGASSENSSPVIFKWGNGEANDFGNFPTITGSEFNVGYVSDTNTLSFTYTPGAGDPSIHYFTIKQANGFELFHDDDPITSGSIAMDPYFFNSQGKPQPGYSHITFFDTGSTSPAVPEPATWAMMLLGFGAVGASLRRRKSANARRLRTAY